MKKTPFIVLLIITFLAEAVLGIILTGKMKLSGQDTVMVNECVKSIEANFGNEEKYNRSLKYVLIDKDGEVLFKTGDGLSESINEAIKKGDLILDVDVNETAGLHVLIHNENAEKIEGYKNRMLLSVIAIALIQLALVFSYFLYLKKTVTDPFKKMSTFASRVAEGNLDLPLDLDKGHIFGAFTESFDLMRSELKKAREAEKKANDDKKETIAKLSHDIKTPIASIKSTSEIGYEITKEERTKEFFNLINIKSDQITNLADNLFHSSINDIAEIDVNPSQQESSEVDKLIRNADYLGKCGDFNLPQCSVFIDKLRLQQAFDNVFMNSYKYAGTDIKVSANIDDEYLILDIVDEGPGVKPEELPLLKEKYKRGSNSAEKEGAGLGLYLTDYFLSRMNGKLELKNTEPGFCAKFYIRRI